MQETPNTSQWNTIAHGSFKILEDSKGIKEIWLDMPHCKNAAQAEKAIKLLIEAGIIQGGTLRIQRNF